MICFRDMTFCESSANRCQNEDCRRFFGVEQSEAARKWWGDDEGEAPVAFTDFWDQCPIRKPTT